MIRSKIEYRIAWCFIFFTIFILDSVFRIREYEDKSIDFQALIKFLVPLGSFFYVFVLVFRAGIVRIVQRYFVHLCFLVYLAFTAIYSLSPVYSAYLFVTYLMLFLFVVYVISYFGFVGFLNVFVVSVLLFSLFSIFLYLFVPSLGRFVYWVDGVLTPSWRMSGLAGSANNFARVVAFGLMILVLYKGSTYRFLGGYLYYFCALVFMGCLMLSGSRTTLFFMLLSLAFYLFVVSGFRIRLAIIAFCVPVFFAFLFFGADIFGAISRDGGSDVTTFTGRSDIWEVAIDLIADSWIFGYGLGSSIYLLPDYSYFLGFAPSHSHNMYLQLMLHGGLVLLVLFFVSLFVCLVRLAKMRAFKVFSMVLFVLLVGVFESGAFSLSVNVFTLIYFSCLIYSAGGVSDRNSL